ncbi:PhzF family phenazine biosynthesis protein [Rhizohabitans arisaemae]|uniref:PhzF family phenazine biosynthesis protein n=1 Tax=Rhizohabitans arisaemae TaxID=2720610 RepID=UPI0024B1B28E|nr:PhzF family phenazine biosynthesis protein [Rhizohabitans arisaemae]
MRLFIVDAFADRPFTGNPAAVCLLDREIDDGRMQAIAAEMNLSETAFLLGDRLRWFTPKAEVALCGHATLATGHVLFEEGVDGRVRFQTLSGGLTVRRGEHGLISMDFPALPVRATPAPAGLAEALGASITWMGTSEFDLLVEVADEAAVREIAPDLAFIAGLDARGVIVTAPGSGEHDFVARCFYPALGIPEDPVTGSAHCATGPYWAGRLGRDSLVGAQLSARGGRVHVTVRGDRVGLAGRAVTVVSGELHG